MSILGCGYFAHFISDCMLLYSGFTHPSSWDQLPRGQLLQGQLLMKSTAMRSTLIKATLTKSTYKNDALHWSTKFQLKSTMVLDCSWVLRDTSPALKRSKRVCVLFSFIWCLGGWAVALDLKLWILASVTASSLWLNKSMPRCLGEAWWWLSSSWNATLQHCCWFWACVG